MLRRRNLLIQHCLGPVSMPMSSALDNHHLKYLMLHMLWSALGSQCIYLITLISGSVVKSGQMKICKSATTNRITTCCPEHANANCNIIWISRFADTQNAEMRICCVIKMYNNQIEVHGFSSRISPHLQGRANATVGGLKINITWPAPCAGYSLCMQALWFHLRQPPLFASCLFSNSYFLPFHSPILPPWPLAQLWKLTRHLNHLG